MKRGRKAGENGGGVAKRAISLPKSLDERLQRLAEGEERTYSALVREAVERLLASRDSGGAPASPAVPAAPSRAPEPAPPAPGLSWRQWP